MKPGRNVPCPCGSKKKYKSCCARESSKAPGADGMLVAMANAGRYQDMESSARELVIAHPNGGFAWKALSVALEMQGKDALEALQRAALLLPEDAESHSNLGAALRRVGRLDEAEACFRRALDLNPSVAEVWNNLGNAQKDLGRLDAAEAALRRALRLKPEFAKAHNNLGNVLQDLGKLEEALASYRRALSLDAGYAEAHSNLGVSLRLQNRAADAEMSCRRALEINPSLPAAILLLAELLSDRGQFTAAQDVFERAIALQPELPEAWAGIAGLRKMTADDAAWLAAAQRIADHCPLLRQEVYLRYAIGKYFDDVGDYPQAFLNYRRANELTKSYRAKHDRRKLTESIDSIIESLDREWLDRVRTDSSPSARPVFIVGMPRSGTTLAEQILAAHGDVFGAGELPFWNCAASTYADLRHTEANGQSALQDVAVEYLDLLHHKANGALRVIDKMPANFLYLGLIHAALPNARIIHLRRNPIDTCLSVYFQNFGVMHSYANDLDDLAHYYSEYLRVMRHWRLMLPHDAVLDVPYEGLIADQESWSRKMLEFVGLSWDANCLEFHRGERTVNTFSKWQARQRINGSSVERWRNYENFVGPLLRLKLDVASAADFL